MISKQTLPCFVPEESTVPSTPLILVSQAGLSLWLEEQSEFIKNWVISNRFKAKPRTHCAVPNEKGIASQILISCEDRHSIWQLAHLPFILPEGAYHAGVIVSPSLEKELEPLSFQQLWSDLALGWGLGAYEFCAFKAGNRLPARLLIPEDVDVLPVQGLLQALYLVRDLINMPTESMGPADLSHAARVVGTYYGAEVTEIVGDELLKENYPAIHAVGRGSSREPRLIDLRWGDPDGRKVTLVGKGVCFDSGGLDLKSARGMALMKKDMGGAAHVLGLASLIMDRRLPLRLRVLIPAVENSVSGLSYRPGDVIQTRKGLSVEIGNTDAEGRLILADALAEAASENPDLVIDMATLTGAARIAIGTDIPILFSNHQVLAEQCLESGREVDELLWQLPLYDGYRNLLDSDIAHINNTSASSYGGAITAALFLKEFVGDDIPWFHFDLMGWNSKSRPGRPKGGEAMGVRALFEFLERWLG